MEKVMDSISTVNGAISGVTSIIEMVLLLGIGLYLTFFSKGVQFRKFGFAMKNTIGKIFQKQKAGEGAITPFQAVCTALAATVGTGNIAGVAGAIAMGGPGAVFWMWVSALLGMCTKFSEVTLAVKFRERNSKGEWVGGPMYYITNGLGKSWKWLACVFAGLAVLASFGIGNATQVSSIKGSINSMLYNFGVFKTEDGLPVVNWIIGIALAAVLLLVMVGGLKRLASVTEKLVPFMAIIYIVFGLGVLIVNFKAIPAAFADIFRGAFSPMSVVSGGVAGLFITMGTTMQRGIARGVFSNEAGMGSAPMAHASAETDHPVRQGLYGIFEVFMDTIVICTMTALVVLCAARGNIVYGVEAGPALTISGFTATYGSWVSIITAIAICSFAFSTILGWSLYGSRCIEYLFGPKSVTPYVVIFGLVAILGATAELDPIWAVADTLNGLMAIPNLIALALLSPVVFKLVKEFFELNAKQPNLRK